MPAAPSASMASSSICEKLGPPKLALITAAPWSFAQFIAAMWPAVSKPNLIGMSEAPQATPATPVPLLPMPTAQPEVSVPCWPLLLIGFGSPSFWHSTKLRGNTILPARSGRSEEHTSELQSQFHLVCRLLLEKKKLNALLHIRISYVSYHNLLVRVYA